MLSLVGVGFVLFVWSGSAGSLAMCTPSTGVVVLFTSWLLTCVALDSMFFSMVATLRGTPLTRGSSVGASCAGVSAGSSLCFSSSGSGRVVAVCDSPVKCKVMPVSKAEPFKIDPRSTPFTINCESSRIACCFCISAPSQYSDLPRPGCCRPTSSGLSTDTKLALTLLTGLLEVEEAEVWYGDRPRLGGEVERVVCLVSKMARRFLTPEEVEVAGVVPVDMTGGPSQQMSRMKKPRAIEEVMVVSQASGLSVLPPWLRGWT